MLDRHLPALRRLTVGAIFLKNRREILDTDPQIRVFCAASYATHP